MRRRAIRIPFVVLLATCSCLAGLAGGAFAAFSASVQAQQTVATLQLGSPASAAATVTASTATACTSVSVTWPAATNANSYRVEARENGGAWSTVMTTGNVTNLVDTTVRSHAVVAWRVHAGHATSGWEGATPAQTLDVTCGVRPVTDLAVDNPCSRTALSWSAPGGGVTTYDVQRRVGGGAWTALATDQTATTYSDITQHAVGALVEYQVRSGIGTATNGNWSTVATVPAWEPFRVESIVVANAGVLGSLNAGDTVTVSFTKPVLRTSIATNSMRADPGGGDRGFYLGTTASGLTGIGKVAFSAFGATASYAGTPGWSNADATWTWTSNAAGTTMTTALANEAFTVGTGPRCAADSTALVAAGTTTSSGRW